MLDSRKTARAGAMIAAALLWAWMLVGSGCSDASGDGGGSSSGQDGSAGPSLDVARQRLQDRLFEFGLASGNSDRNAFLTGVNQLQLCAFGKFGWKQTTSFSSSVGSTVSEAMHLGTWTLKKAGGQTVVHLAVEQSNDKNPPTEQQFVVTIEGEGVRFDGAAATEADASADCEHAKETWK